MSESSDRSFALVGFAHWTRRDVRRGSNLNEGTDDDSDRPDRFFEVKMIDGLTNDLLLPCLMFLSPYPTRRRIRSF